MSTQHVPPVTRRWAVRLANDRVTVFERDGIYQARIRLENGRYACRSLKTRNRQDAISAAWKLFHSLEYRQEAGLPLNSKLFSSVIDEYIAMRERLVSQGRSSRFMLQKFKAVGRFWREYAGHLPIELIGNKELAEYLPWRRAYYSHFEQLPKNAKLVPADTTLKYEVMIGKAFIRWANEQGYRGEQQLPTLSFAPRHKRARPSFETNEYRHILKELARWRRECTNDVWLHTRVLLSDYVLILANSGMRVGEANSLRIQDVRLFQDALGRRNYRFIVHGKTGARDLIIRASAAKSVHRLLKRRDSAKPTDYLFVMSNGARVPTLAEQFNKVLRRVGLLKNAKGEKYSLYSLNELSSKLFLCWKS